MSNQHPHPHQHHGDPSPTTMSTTTTKITTTTPTTTPTLLPTPKLPLPQLESLKFKANQIIESIHALQWTIGAGGRQDGMPAWPDILSKYNVLLGQTHNFSTGLLQPFPTSSSSSSSSGANKTAGTGMGGGTGPQNVFERIALHPNRAMTDLQLDGDVIPLLRNQQTTDVLRMENETVRRLAEHMQTRGSLGVLGISPPAGPAAGLGLGMGLGVGKKPEYEDVLEECGVIKNAHDRRVERAVRAVDMLKEKFDWKQRVMVEVEEPEELEWDPRLVGVAVPEEEDVGMSEDEEEEGEEAVLNSEDAPLGAGNSDEDDEFNVEGALFNTSPSAEFGVASSFSMDAT
ncbi:hypothetical protein JR316_0011405 [Psilocybe cubensis]|uniref:Mediator of RNA polymerase II transcription subunit 8 n=2 Tax=Psilocybe cubensis TaxID=181762 RepID=A0A8H7XWU3_PSICU|nr:hypothetical protein JR316_0011405 [Psilocybe cubensis]KAH9475845.1 hypothetical protein JR316_0011405 [Psilocybe cubensis]